MSNHLNLDQIIVGDCIEVLPRLPKDSIDLVFADPPYNLQLANELYRPNATRVDAVNDYWDKFTGFKDYDTFTLNWLTACRDVLKETGALWVIGTYHNIYRIGKIVQDLDFWILNDICWIKGNPMPNFRGTRFTNAHETLIWAQKKKDAKYTFNYHAMKALNEELQMRSDWYMPLCTGNERVKQNGKKAHSTQKPEQLLYRIILATTNPGDVVLDPFLGSGTTAVIARKLRRHYIGIEQDRTYAAIAQDRIRAGKPISEIAVNIDDPRQQKRIPFGSLLENGLIEPGQELIFDNSGIKAIVMANGHIRCGEITGSIHSVAKSLLHAPCNGWECWHILDQAGKPVSIDKLRQTLRRKKNKSGDVK